MEQDVRMRYIRLALRFDPAKLYMMSTGMEYDFMQDRRDIGRLPEFHVQQVASHMTVQLMEHTFNFKPVDATPQYVTEARKSIEDFQLFATPLVRTEQIIVAPESVSELMEKIRKMQAPELAAIRERNARSTASEAAPMVQTKFHAQILSFAA